MSILMRLKRKIYGEIKFAKSIGVKVGEDCEFYHGIIWGSEPYLIEIGNHVRITTGCKFVTHDGGLWVLRKKYNKDTIDRFGKIVIGNNVHIGWDTIIMPGVTIGDNVVIGCGSVVTKDIPSNSVYAGVPARKIEDIEEYYQKITSKAIDTKGLNYLEKREKILNYYNEGFKDEK